MSFTQGRFLKYRRGGRTPNVLIEALHAAFPRGEVHTGEIAERISTAVDCHCIVATVSRQAADLNRHPNARNGEAVSEYRQTVGGLLRQSRLLDGDDKVRVPFLSLSLHGMADRWPLDIELGTVFGGSCDDNVLQWLLSQVQKWVTALPGARRIPVVAANRQWYGDPVIATHRIGDQTAGYAGYGDRFNCVQVETARWLRDAHRDAIVDFFSTIAVEFARLFGEPPRAGKGQVPIKASDLCTVFLSTKHAAWDGKIPVLLVHDDLEYVDVYRPDDMLPGETTAAQYVRDFLNQSKEHAGDWCDKTPEALDLARRFLAGEPPGPKSVEVIGEPSGPQGRSSGRRPRSAITHMDLVLTLQDTVTHTFPFLKAETVYKWMEYGLLTPVQPPRSPEGEICLSFSDRVYMGIISSVFLLGVRPQYNGPEGRPLALRDLMRFQFRSEEDKARISTTYRLPQLFLEFYRYEAYVLIEYHGGPPSVRFCTEDRYREYACNEITLAGVISAAYWRELAVRSEQKLVRGVGV